MVLLGQSTGVLPVPKVLPVLVGPRVLLVLLALLVLKDHLVLPVLLARPASKELLVLRVRLELLVLKARQVLARLIQPRAAVLVTLSGHLMLVCLLPPLARQLAAVLATLLE